MNFNPKINPAWVALVAVGLAGVHARGDAPAAAEVEALEIGGVVTLDYGLPTDDLKAQSLEVGTVELSAVVNVNPQIKGFITLLAEGNLGDISIDQAIADLTLTQLPAEVLFGQQAFNFGLMSTRLISDPLGVDLVAPSQPGITGLYTRGPLVCGLAALMTERSAPAAPGQVVTLTGDTVELPDQALPGNRSPGGVMNVDYGFGGGSLVRFSSLLARENVGVDLACNAAFGRLTLDAEAYSRLVARGSAAKEAAYTVGIAYGITDRLSVALRHDGLGADQFKDLTTRYGVGATVTVFGDCFAAVEYGYENPVAGPAVGSIALQLGLESKLKLPGFQRKTLTRE